MVDVHLVAGTTALAAGRWADAAAELRASVTSTDAASAHFGLAVAQWWLGESSEAVHACTTAYARFRDEGDDTSAVQCAVWLAITYKSNFDNPVAAGGWLARADRLLHDRDESSGHGWVHVARAYRHPDLVAAANWSAEAVRIAQRVGDVDLQLVAVSHLGLVTVGMGDTEAGFALIDEATAAALAGEGSTLDTVVYTCCDMLNACELADDVERAARWCSVADDFVDTYGCPFLYAECRIFYGSVLTARGRWAQAERELRAGLEITAGSCPGLHARAIVRLALLRIRQGLIEEADHLLAGLEGGLALELDGAVAVAAAALARGDASGAGHRLERHVKRVGLARANRLAALDLLVEVHLRAGDRVAAERVARQLTELAQAGADRRVWTAAATAAGRVAAAAGDVDAALAQFDRALELHSHVQLPFERAMVHLEVAELMSSIDGALATDHADAALRGFEVLGARRGVDRAAQVLRTLGAPRRRAPGDSARLTDREQEVLVLVGHGLSNPEIAARLHVSRKTASHHVSSILRKLGMRNRVEAAAYAVSHNAELR